MTLMNAHLRKLRHMARVEQPYRSGVTPWRAEEAAPGTTPQPPRDERATVERNELVGFLAFLIGIGTDQVTVEASDVGGCERRKTVHIARVEEDKRALLWLLQAKVMKSKPKSNSENAATDAPMDEPLSAAKEPPAGAVRTRRTRRVRLRQRQLQREREEG